MIQWRARGLFKDSILQHLLLYDYLLLLFKNNRKGIFKREMPPLASSSVVINASQKTSSASTINLMFCTTKMDHYCIFFFSSHLTNWSAAAPLVI